MVSIAVKGGPVNICTDTLHDGEEVAPVGWTAYSLP